MKLHLQYNALLLIPLFMVLGCNKSQDQSVKLKPHLFYDDFESGIDNWFLNNSLNVNLIDSKDSKHGNVMELTPGGSNTFALIKGSENWNGVTVEGDVLFPDNEHNYLGFIYNYTTTNKRADYGCIYIKGNSSYVRVNPHRDGQVSRIIYDEYRTNLKGPDSIVVGKWQHFKAEVVGNSCHFYVGDMTVPKITFPFFEFSSGKIGFEPRVIGAPVWIDNIIVKELKKHAYKEFQPKEIVYEPEKLLTHWQLIGPFRKPMEKIEKNGFISTKTYNVHNLNYSWKPFKADGRGCIIGGQIMEWAARKNHIYLSKEITSEITTQANLEFSTTNDLKIWLNGELVGEIKGGYKAWYDFWKNPKHAGEKISINLKKGENELLILDIGMPWPDYAGDGFYAKLNL